MESNSNSPSQPFLSIVKHNRDDMKAIRETIVEENEMCGFENPNLVGREI
jgi:hypothetical protein